MTAGRLLSSGQVTDWDLVEKLWRQVSQSTDSGSRAPSVHRSPRQCLSSVVLQGYNGTRYCVGIGDSANGIGDGTGWEDLDAQVPPPPAAGPHMLLWLHSALVYPGN